MIMRKKLSALLAMSILTASLMVGCGANKMESQDTGATAEQENVKETKTNAKVNTETEESDDSDNNYLSIAKQGMFSSGGTVTKPVEGEFDETTNWMDTSRAGNTAHVDHANVLYQISAEDNGNPIVYLHGYGSVQNGMDDNARWKRWLVEYVFKRWTCSIFSRSAKTW